MKVAYLVEGSTDCAVLEGLRLRWRPDVELSEIRYRGSRLRHRDYPKYCADARLKGAEAIVLLTDGNGRDWRQVKREEAHAFPRPSPLDILIGVCDRNVECWLCSDTRYASQKLGCDEADVSVSDPKRAFEAAMGIDRERKRETEIVTFVREAPVGEWIRRSGSFRAFYHDARDLAQRRGCAFPNEEERT